MTSVLHGVDTRSRILVVEDDPGFSTLIRRNLEGHDYEVQMLRTGAEALDWLAANPVDLMILDYRLKDMTADVLIDGMSRIAKPTEFIVITGYGDEKVAVEMMKRGARDYLMKDGSLLELLPTVVGQALVGARQENQLRDTEQALHLLDAAVRQTKDAIVIIGAEMTTTLPDIVYVNPAFTEMTGFAGDKSIGESLSILIGEETDAMELERFGACLRAGEHYAGRLTLYKKDGGSFLAEVDLAPILGSDSKISNFVLVQRDVTVSAQMEEQLRNSQKMEAIGKLAGGVAHDFNNVLTVITGYADLLGSDPKVPDELHREALDNILGAAQHATSLTRQLLTFSRRQVVRPELLDLNSGVLETQSMLTRLIGEDVELETDLTSESTCVRIDAGHLEQILFNLAINAREAMPNGGSLWIRTSNVAETEADPQGNSVGARVCLRVEDNGSGMNSETHSRLFEPFFTTKQSGTGLGLATVYAIVSQSGGEITASSKEGVGTTISVFLPRIIHEVPTEGQRPVPVSDSRGETILLVEDEELVRDLVCATLRHRGYNVIEACDCDSALLLFDETDGVDLVLTDMVMPGSSGLDLVNQLREVDRSVRVLFMSGYSGRNARASLAADADAEFIQKPFTPSDLHRRIHDILSR